MMNKTWLRNILGSVELRFLQLMDTIHRYLSEDISLDKTLDIIEQDEPGAAIQLLHGTPKSELEVTYGALYKEVEELSEEIIPSEEVLVFNSKSIEDYKIMVQYNSDENLVEYTVGRVH